MRAPAHPLPDSVVQFFRVAIFTIALTLSGCFRLSGNSWYEGPPSRPEAMETYYKPERSYGAFREEIEKTTDRYTHKRISIDSYAGPIVVDYFQAAERSDSLVLVFPVLGGKNFIEKHIARYLVESGFDAAIVNRSNEFKDPANFEHLEEIFRLNVIRDRLALDFFQGEYGKKKFGSFGISRGAINVALTAGVDPRLEYNVLALGGTDLVNLFRDSSQARIEKYIQTVSDNRGYSKDQFFKALRAQLRTDPKYTAQYLDSRKTLLVLGIFDRTVPFSYGLKLREQIGRPETIFLFADHYVSLAYTQTISLLPPSKEKTGIFPFPYIEQEAVSFYKRAFDEGWNWKSLPFRLLQLPVNLVAEGLADVGSLFEWMSGSEENSQAVSQEQLDHWNNPRPAEIKLEPLQVKEGEPKVIAMRVPQ
jgi:hypothetical protein